MIMNRRAHGLIVIFIAVVMQSMYVSECSVYSAVTSAVGSAVSWLPGKNESPSDNMEDNLPLADHKINEHVPRPKTTKTKRQRAAVKKNTAKHLNNLEQLPFGGTKANVDEDEEHQSVLNSEPIPVPQSTSIQPQPATRKQIEEKMNDFKSKIVPQYSFPKKTYAVPNLKTYNPPRELKAFGKHYRTLLEAINYLKQNLNYIKQYTDRGQQISILVDMVDYVHLTTGLKNRLCSVEFVTKGAKDAMNTGIRDLNYWLWLQVNKVAADIRERLLDTKPKLNDDELHLIVLDIKHRMDIKPQGASIRNLDFYFTSEIRIRYGKNSEFFAVNKNNLQRLRHGLKNILDN